MIPSSSSRLPEAGEKGGERKGYGALITRHKCRASRINLSVSNKVVLASKRLRS